MPPHILFADSNHVVRDVLAEELEKAGCTVTRAGSLKDAKSKLSDGPYDLVIANYQLGDGTGGDFLRALRKTSAAPVLMIASRDLNKIIDHGGHDFDYLQQGTPTFSKEVFLRKAKEILARSADALVVTPAHSATRRANVGLRRSTGWVLRANRDVA